MRAVTTGALHIREARPADDAAIGELLVHAFRSQYAEKMPQVVMTEERIAELRNVAIMREQGMVLLAELGGRVVGCVSLLRPGAKHSEAWIPGAANIRQLAVAISHQGRGLGTPLMDSAETVARWWDSVAICLHVRRGAHGVARLYARRGYTREPKGDLDFLPDVFLEAYVLNLR
jgi:predicted N-acetyltransferase YhbS